MSYADDASSYLPPGAVTASIESSISVQCYSNLLSHAKPMRYLSIPHALVGPVPSARIGAGFRKPGVHVNVCHMSVSLHRMREAGAWRNSVPFLRRSETRGSRERLSNALDTIDRCTSAPSPHLLNPKGGPSRLTLAWPPSSTFAHRSCSVGVLNVHLSSQKEVLRSCSLRVRSTCRRRRCRRGKRGTSLAATVGGVLARCSARGADRRSRSCSRSRSGTVDSR